MKAANRTGIVRGYAPDKKAEARLKKAGVGTKITYRAHEGETFDTVKLESGDTLKVVDGFKAFGDTRTVILESVQKVHSRGATIIDAETGLNSRDNWPEMLKAALWPHDSAEHARMMSAKAKAKKTAGRMGDREALAIWRDPKLSVDEALDLMPGWKKATAYDTFGKRNIGAGRRPNALKK